MPEEYRHSSTNEPLYHQPPTALDPQDRYQSSCVTGEVPGLVTAGNSLTSPYFSQHQLRMGQGSGRRFSPLRLPLGASKSSWRRCSWRCTTVVFVCVTLCLAATTTFFASEYYPFVSEYYPFVSEYYPLYYPFVSEYYPFVSIIPSSVSISFVPYYPIVSINPFVSEYYPFVSEYYPSS
nr:uncharacterized protein LOC128704969 [Cherax quadricarinatus]